MGRADKKENSKDNPRDAFNNSTSGYIGDCNQFSEQNLINFYGLNQEENSKLLKYLFKTAVGVTMGVAVNAQTPEAAFEYVGNPFRQPNRTGLNWWGSGDANNDNVVNQADVDRVGQVANGSYTNPSDKRLIPRSDVNGDGLVTSADKSILQNYVNGTIDHLEAYLDKLTTQEQRQNWFRKIGVLAKLSETCKDKANYPGYICDCNQYSENGLIQFNYNDKATLERFLQTYPGYDTTKNNLFNWPLFQESFTIFANEEQAGHAMLAFASGENALNYSNLEHFEPQFDDPDTKIGEHYFGIGDSSRIYLRNAPIIQENFPNQTPLGYYIKYWIKNKIPDSNLTYLYEKNPSNPANIPMITRIEHDNPNVNIISPSPGVVYASTPRLITNVEDETIFDRYKLAEDGVTKLYYNKNIYYLLNSEQAKNEMFKHTDRALDLAEGDHTITVKAKDEFDNETTKAVSFAIDKTNPDLKTTSPKQDSVYKENNVKLNYNIIDAHLDLGNSYFKLNNGQQQFFTTPSGIILLNSRLGENRLEIISKDKAGNETKKTIDYEYTPQTGLEDKIEYSEYGDMPNPTTGVTKSFYPKNKTVVIRYWDMSGKKVKEVKDFDGDGETSVDFSNEPDAMYIRETIDEDGNRNVGKVLKTSSGK